MSQFYTCLRPPNFPVALPLLPVPPKLFSSHTLLLTQAVTRLNHCHADSCYRDGRTSSPTSMSGICHGNLHLHLSLHNMRCPRTLPSSSNSHNPYPAMVYPLLHHHQQRSSAQLRPTWSSRTLDLASRQSLAFILNCRHSRMAIRCPRSHQRRPIHPT